MKFSSLGLSVLLVFTFIFYFTLLWSTHSFAAERQGHFKLIPQVKVVKPGALLHMSYETKNLDDPAEPSECIPLNYLFHAPQRWLRLQPKRTDCLRPGEFRGEKEHASVTLEVPKDAVAGDYRVSAEVVRDGQAMKRFALDATVIRVSNCIPSSPLSIEDLDMEKDSAKRIAFRAGDRAGCWYILESSDDLVNWRVDDILTSDLPNKEFSFIVGGRDANPPEERKFYRVQSFDPPNF